VVAASRSPLRALTAIGLALCLAAAIYFPLALLVPTSRSEERRVRIPPGAGYGAAVRAFHEAGVIPAEFPLRVLGRLTGVERAVRPGIYRIPPGESALDVFRRLEEGRIETVTLTIPEGYALTEIARAVEKAGLASAAAFLEAARDPVLARRLGIPAPSFEGFLFPDTYHVPVGTEPQELVRMMTDRFRRVLGPDLLRGFSASGLSLLEGVTLASIVEKEARRDEERPLIAAVFLNRLRRGMRLEADPTILYGVRPLGGKPIRRSEIHRKTPYNTYVIRGLPPGPIASPGLASLRAVAFPAKTDYLYFVSQNDGTHKFSSTLREHNRAVRRYRRNG